MRLELQREQAEELDALLDITLRDMSHEIADTDNFEFRAGLSARRDKLRAIKESLDQLLAQSSPRDGS